MRLRRYRANDLPAVVDITAVANIDDTLSRYMTRNICENWLSYRHGTLRWLRNEIFEIGAVAWVVETEEGDDLPKPGGRESSVVPGQVVGWCTYTRMGTSPMAQRWRAPNGTWRMKLERFLYKIEAKYYEYIPRANPSWDVEHNRQISAVVHEPFDEDIFADAWVLQVLYVNPNWQRRGVGSMLVRWGVEQGQKEKVPVVVSSSPMGIAMYERFGFKVLKRLEVEEFFDPGGRGLNDLVWEPEGVDGRWLERAKEMERQKKEKAKKEKERSGGG